MQQSMLSPLNSGLRVLPFSFSVCPGKFLPPSSTSGTNEIPLPLDVSPSKPTRNNTTLLYCLDCFPQGCPLVPSSSCFLLPLYPPCPSLLASHPFSLHLCWYPFCIIYPFSLLYCYLPPVRCLLLHCPSFVAFCPDFLLLALH